MKYLGVDYGKKKMGLSVSEGQVASPLSVIKITGLNDGAEKISQVIQREEVDLVVVGVAESGEARKISKKLVAELKKRHEIVQVMEFEETLSSFEARELMLELNIPKKKRQDEDAYSAVLILQNFLNSLN